MSNLLAGTGITLDWDDVTKELTINNTGGSAVDSVNGQTGVVVLDADDIDDTSTTNKFATAAELTKLAGIEALADVTDAGNVAAAGAVMTSAIGSTVQAHDADLDTIAGLADPNADRILFWDDSANAYAYLTPGTNLTITGTTIDATGGGAADLDDLSDVDTTTSTPADGDVLTFDSADSTWKPSAPTGGGSTLAVSGETAPHGSLSITSSSTSATKGNEVLAVADGTITSVSVEVDRVSGRTYRFWFFELANESTGQLGAQIGSSADGVAAASGIGLVSVSGLNWPVTAGSRYVFLVTDLSGTGTTALAIRTQNTGGTDFWIGPGVPVGSVGRIHRYDTLTPTIGNTSTSSGNFSYYFKWTGTVASSSYTDEKAQDAVGGILTDSTNIDFTYTDVSNQITADLTAAAKTFTINFIIDGGGSTITTGVKGFIVVDRACTIVRNRALADQSGSIVVDIWKDTYANYPPVDADSITASAPVTISSATKSEDSTLTGWTTSVSAGDVLGFNVDSVTTLQRVTISLKCVAS